MPSQDELVDKLFDKAIDLSADVIRKIVDKKLSDPPANPAPAAPPHLASPTEAEAPTDPLSPLPPAASPVQRPAVRARLWIMQGETVLRVVELARFPILIGRLPQCDLYINDPEVSRSHAEIREQDGRITLTDLHSRNGTTVNGGRITQYVLRTGDRIKLGNTILVFGFA